ncbi:crotonase/enoyl-CoA hydratase family protein [Marinobacter sp. M216]|uniref:Crotonase/enoyl-CoA hydratase family protein n=1 Tax=Marinobacter albus TaxID=3030833 RepID=A0ABT7H9D6_9GAMM|nr:MULTISPECIES: crotonase/enoyl-CoA hydratase family protein [unclassified Marinobacter]MBW7470766.1 crotonase/enoyl-CoA hydratase family protein [Marinobacter sp. F4218]MDK9556964.1 crotonase/enoyl-CoA hydratase family protein [Marinobacter sp. M216]
MTDLVEYQLNDGVATIVIANGKANALSHDVFEQLNQALDRAEKDGAVVILTGQPGIFSGGYDLKEMQKGPSEASALVTVGSKLTRRLAAFPLPVIGACSGHAIAKGAFIMLSVDHRIGIEGNFKLGLNEVAIGMTMHHTGIEIARHRLAPAHFYRSVVNAEIYDPEGAVAAGFLDEVVAPSELMVRANELAQQFRKLNMRAHRETKCKAKADYLNLLDRCIEQDSAHLGLSG